MELVDPWLYVVVFLLALAEGAALLGLFLPGESAMLLAGWLVSQGRASLGIVVAVAVIGSVLGDSIGYWSGRRFGYRLRMSALGKRVGTDRWLRAERFILSRGKAAVSIGRFASFLRTLVPPLAGLSGMPYRDFALFNAPAAAAWATLFVMLGALAGGSWDAIVHWTGWAGKFVVVLLVAGTGVALAVRRLRRQVAPSVNSTGVGGTVNRSEGDQVAVPDRRE